jgi:hypothetical protein
MAKPQQIPVIIKKVKSRGEHAHHGGAWKVAYADFVTAMMAFFLLLWLLNVTTDIQKRGIADYFEPTIASKSQSGAGGVLGGLTIGQPGAQAVPLSAPALAINRPALRQPNEGDQGNEGGTAGHDADGCALLPLVWGSRSFPRHGKDICDFPRRPLLRDALRLDARPALRSLRISDSGYGRRSPRRPILAGPPRQ